MFKGIEGPLVFIVLDGVGETEREIGNAVRLAHMPFFNKLRGECRFTTLKAHGTSVGLPSDKDMGNSEVGHNALGSGQVYEQGAKLVNNAIESGDLFRGKEWNTAIDRVLCNKGTLHFMGLLSDGNVHSHIDHLLAMLREASDRGVARARIHALLDGRDVSGTSAQIYIRQLEEQLDALRGAGRDYRIASGGGRMVLTMDRYEADWRMVEAGWRHHVHGEGRGFPDALNALETLRAENENIIDQDLPGFVITDENGPVGIIQDDDSVLFFNFRGDRGIEISRAFDEGDEFDAFDRKTKPDVFYAGMMQYDGDILSPNHYLVGPPRINHTLSEFLVSEKIQQYAISETQKYGHVTYFWNGNRSGKLDPASEVFVEVPSDLVPFDQRPWMKAAEITDRLIEAIAEDRYRFLRVNYANGDMVGHTGDLNASIIAMGCLDIQLNRLLNAVAKVGGVAIVTADHGNCDEMFELGKGGTPLTEANGRIKPKTSHTLNPVPFLLFDPRSQVPATLKQSSDFGLANLAATSVELLGLQAPHYWNPSVFDWRA